MRCSLSFVLAAFVATASASELADKILDQHHTRFLRRTPTERHSYEKGLVNGKCFWDACDAGAIYQGAFSGFAQFSRVESFTQAGGFPNLVGSQGAVFSSISSWQSRVQALGVISNSLLVFGNWVQSTQITMQIIQSSFINFVQTLVIVVQRIQSLGPFDGDAGFVSVYVQLLVGIQGFLVFVTKTFGSQVFTSTVGAVWSQFSSLMVIMIRFGSISRFFRTPSLIIDQGVNLDIWKKQWGFVQIEQYVDIQSFQTKSINVGTWGAGLSGGFAGAQIWSMSSSSSYEASQSSSTQIEQSIGAYLSGGLDHSPKIGGFDDPHDDGGWGKPQAGSGLGHPQDGGHFDQDDGFPGPQDDGLGPPRRGGKIQNDGPPQNGGQLQNDGRPRTAVDPRTAVSHRTAVNFKECKLAPRAMMALQPWAASRTQISNLLDFYLTHSYA